MNTAASADPRRFLFLKNALNFLLAFPPLNDFMIQYPSFG
jgi:hypothetical protein